MCSLLLLEKYPILFFHQDLTKANHTLALHVELPEFSQDFIFSQESQEMAKVLHADRKSHFQQLLSKAGGQRAL